MIEFFASSPVQESDALLIISPLSLPSFLLRPHQLVGSFAHVWSHVMPEAQNIVPKEVRMNGNITCMPFGGVLHTTLPCLNLLAAFSQPRTSIVSQPSIIQPDRNTELNFILRRTQGQEEQCN